MRHSQRCGTPSWGTPTHYAVTAVDSEPEFLKVFLSLSMPFNCELELGLIETRPRKKGQGRRASLDLHFRRLHYRIRPPESNNTVILWGVRERPAGWWHGITELNFREGRSSEQRAQLCVPVERRLAQPHRLRVHWP